jgi:hypothetical protein
MSSTKRVDLETSVAGEEDPGASNEIGSARESPGRADQPAGKRGDEPAAATANAASRPMAPGDEAPAGTPGTGENVCPDCGGSGQRAGRECPTCRGSGKVTVGIGGA